MAHGRPGNVAAAESVFTQFGLDATHERRITEHGIEMGRDGRNRQGMVLARDRAVQIGQGLGIIEGFDLGQ